MIMATSKVRRLNKITLYFLMTVGILLTLSGCKQNLVDFSNEVPKRQWFYRDHVVAKFEIKDSSKPYNIFFKLRHTADYRYSNIFVLVHFIDGKQKITKRYQYRLAENDGRWLGSGSGNLFNYTLPMLTNHRFSHNGIFRIEIEQNMRDNPLQEIADLGILIEETKAR